MIGIRRLWPFRSFTNFVFSTVGVVGLGTIAYSYLNDRKFSNNPLIDQAVKIIGSNSSAVNLLGVPIDMINDMDNSASIEDKQVYYHFAIRGPKSSTKAELNATKMTVAEINRKIEKQKQVRRRLAQKVEEQKNQQLALKNYKKQQLRAAQFALKTLTAQINKISEELSAAEFEKLNCIKKYYIPEFQLYNKVVKNKAPKDLLPESEFLYGIDGLAVHLPNKSRIVILPALRTNAAGEEQIVPPSFTEEERKLYSMEKLDEGYLSERLLQRMKDLSDEQLANYSKHKNNMMYTKHSRIRSTFMAIMAIAAVALYLVASKNRLHSVSGSFIVHEAERLLLNNPKLSSILSQAKRSKNTLKLHQVILGGRKGNNFECQIDIQGFPGAKVDMHGVLESEGHVKFSKYDLIYRQNGETKKVNMLV